MSASYATMMTKKCGALLKRTKSVTHVAIFDGTYLRGVPSERIICSHVCHERIICIHMHPCLP